MMGAVVYFVGAGPGDPGLITARGLACIRRADVLAYDRLVCPALVAQARPGAELIYVGKEHGQSGRKQADINGLLADRALAGQVVCRLKGGDPFVFGRGGEEAELLGALGVRYEVVPGITSGLAAPAWAGIPVTHRDFAGSVTMVTGHDAPGKQGPVIDWDRLATGSETLLIYMGVQALPEIMAQLIRAGRGPTTPAAVIAWGTTAQQRVITGTIASIADIAQQAGVKSPAMTVVGEVVALRERLAWAEARPLSGLRVLVPTVGTEPTQSGWALREAGAEVWEWPVGSGVQPRLETAPILVGAVAKGQIGAVYCSSPQSLGLLVACMGGSGALGGLPLFCADAQTARAAAQAGLQPAGIAGDDALIPLLTGEIWHVAAAI
jgi:uroporphyrinogen III methyltransferase/synthase